MGLVKKNFFYREPNGPVDSQHLLSLFFKIGHAYDVSHILITAETNQIRYLDDSLATDIAARYIEIEFKPKPTGTRSIPSAQPIFTQRKVIIFLNSLDLTQTNFRLFLTQPGLVNR